MATLGKYSFGVGDRFGKQGKAQLQAVVDIRSAGVEVTPVWNKSQREHETVGSHPKSLREEADEAVKDLGFEQAYFVDADHINLKTVDRFIPYSNFFTLDVAEFIGTKASEKEEEKFLQMFQYYMGDFKIPGIQHKMQISKSHLREMLDNFLLPAQKAGEIYAYLNSKKREDFHVEVSIDEVENPQSPLELFFILAALAFYKVPVNTIAPKFSGEFNKGVDYVGDLKEFEKEFEEDLLVLHFAVKEFNFPQNLKLSVHSGSDKFSIYPIIKRLIKKHDSGLHLKTAGTTWLEELTGLAESEGDGFEFAKDIYAQSLDRYGELTRDYKSVLSIDKEKLPAPESFATGKEFAEALRHETGSTTCNPHFRQLLHCAYKIAAENSKQFYPLLEKHSGNIEHNVTDNLFRKHLQPLFLQ